MGGALAASITYGHSYQVVLHIILDEIVTGPQHGTLSFLYPYPR